MYINLSLSVTLVLQVPPHYPCHTLVCVDDINKSTKLCFSIPGPCKQPVKKHHRKPWEENTTQTTMCIMDPNHITAMNARSKSLLHWSCIFRFRGQQKLLKCCNDVKKKNVENDLWNMAFAGKQSSQLSNVRREHTTWALCSLVMGEGWEHRINSPDK